MPDFARKYSMSCAACHATFPRLNQLGGYFRDNNMRLPDSRRTRLDTGGENLALPSCPPLAIRARACAQARTGRSIDPISGAMLDASNDFQVPRLAKLLSSAPPVPPAGSAGAARRRLHLCAAANRAAQAHFFATLARRAPRRARLCRVA